MRLISVCILHKAVVQQESICKPFGLLVRPCIQSWLNLDSTTCIPSDEDDFRDVRKEVIDMAARWQDLGSSLGIRMSDIETIRAAHASPTTCLLDMLVLWLRQSYKVCSQLCYNVSLMSRPPIPTSRDQG